MLIRKWAVLTLFLPLFQMGYSQNKDNEPKTKRNWNTYVDLGVGITKHKIRDEATSPLRYSGNLLSSYGAFLKEHKDRIWRVYGGFNYGQIKKAVNGSTYIGTAYNGYAGMSVLFGLKRWSTDKLFIYVGGDALWTGDFRLNFNFQNAAYNYNLTTSIGPSAAVHYKFGWKAKSFKMAGLKFNRKDRNLKISYQLNTPLVFNYIRPDYSVINDFTNGESSSSFDNNHTTFLGDAFRLNMRSELYYYFHNENAVKFNYMWEFTKVKDENFIVDSSNHYFLISLLFRLSPTTKNDTNEPLK